jgi:pimeloyl-ACP methyl ester carboxylesterase
MTINWQSAIRRTAKWLGWGIVFLLAVAILVLVGFRVAAMVRENADPKTAAPATGHFVRGNDVDMFVQEMGPKDGPAVLFVHAAGGWSEVWKKTVQPLAAKGYHTIAVDMPPLGYSERPTEARYGRGDQAKRILGVLDSLHVRRAALVGHSFGARATVEAAMIAPDRVSALVIVDGALNVPPEGGTTTTSSGLLSAVLQVGVLRNLITAATLSNPLFTHRLLELFVNDPKSATEEWVSIYQQPLTVRGTTAAVGSWLPELLTEHGDSKSVIPTSYTRLPMPTLILWGADDTITLPRDAYRLQKLIPNSQLVLLSGVGHLPPIEDTGAFNKALMNFLQNHRDTL